MNWQFSILDRSGTQHNISEPVGWDATSIVIKRDLDKHGVMFDYQGNQFRFHKKAAELLKTEYEEYGAEGQMVLIIALGCRPDPQELYRGRFVFKGYKYTCGPECFVTIAIETDSDVMTLTNRFDQAVDLQTNKGFDLTTSLAPYTRLPFDIKLPSKAVLIKDHAINEYQRTSTKNFPTSDDLGNFMLDIPFSKSVAQEVGNCYFNNEIGYTWVGSYPFMVYYPPSGSTFFMQPSYLSPIVNFSEGSANYLDYRSPSTLSYRVKGSITPVGDARITQLGLFCLRLPVTKTGVPGSGDTNLLDEYEVIDAQIVFNSFSGMSSETLFDLTFTDASFQLNRDDRLYFFLKISIGTSGSVPVSYNLNFDQETFFKLEDLSKTDPTVSRVFMVNEAWSRIVEAITDDKIRAYSEYFGRTDSQPYSHTADGCGSLEILTKGLFIRRQENRLPDPYVAALSLKDMWDGLDPIHHIGLGIEPDQNRGGYNVLRIEHYRYFYKDVEIMACHDVAEVDRKMIEGEIYSIFRFGYNKWEAEEYNGLDEFLTKRGYRSMLSTIRNELSRLSIFIASGYAWEITRRKGDIDSKDWRYDNDTFIACVKRDARTLSLDLHGDFLATSFYSNDDPVGLLVGDVVIVTGSTLNNGTYTIVDIVDFGGNWGIYFSTAVTLELGQNITMNLLSPGFIIEQGNVSSAANIIDPDSIYNYRISPIRNALRWLDKVLASYKKDRPGNRLVFMDGDANYQASGEMISTDCKPEAGIISENADLEKIALDDPDNGVPLLAPERIEFEYPLSFAEFKSIKANPYGYITWSTDCENGQGWIDTIDYQPEEGKAKFLLIPKYT